MGSTVGGLIIGRAAAVFGSSLSSPYCRLSRLDIAFSCVTDAVGVPVAAALASNTSLIYLDVSHNRLTGLFAQTAAAALLTNSTLRELRAGFQPLGIEGCRALLHVSEGSKARVLGVTKSWVRLHLLVIIAFYPNFAQLSHISAIFPGL